MGDEVIGRKGLMESGKWKEGWGGINNESRNTRKHGWYQVRSTNST